MTQSSHTIFATALFPKRSYSEILVVRTLTYLFFFFNVLFIYLPEREREKGCAQAGEGWQVEGEAGSLLRESISGLWDHDMSQRQMPN